MRGAHGVAEWGMTEHPSTPLVVSALSAYLPQASPPSPRIGKQSVSTWIVTQLFPVLLLRLPQQERLWVIDRDYP